MRIAVVGVGKIARDQHLPAIAADADYELVATVDPNGGLEGIPAFASCEELRASGPEVDAVSICTPPATRRDLAALAIAAGWHTMLEKPPAANVAQAEALAAQAAGAGITLFASWHSRAAAGVEPARAWLEERDVRSVRIDWQENIREWHPGQEWILAPGGFGVFDPGINALSILTELLPEAVQIDRSLFLTPKGRASPIAVQLWGTCGRASFAADFDFLKEGDQVWTIEIETDSGTLSLRDGGAACYIDGRQFPLSDMSEYASLYRRFHDLIRTGRSDVDLEPLRIVESAARVAQHQEGAPFTF